MYVISENIHNFLMHLTNVYQATPMENSSEKSTQKSAKSAPCRDIDFRLLILLCLELEVSITHLWNTCTISALTVVKVGPDVVTSGCIVTSGWMLGRYFTAGLNFMY